jgi:hypothetical protein
MLRSVSMIILSALAIIIVILLRWSGLVQS